ncbi:Uma2 family endonuclease [Allorhizocola rhizosphaerae]|uniref:Uma2 family endonuclease n=1 Tax=Allorhizocola rhizosphaerae TaxID=1872709 RepID=UPI0013C2D11C|nr:Uma2 family endonuclease [Allorhizocola rhizosphaerae]
MTAQPVTVGRSQPGGRKSGWWQPKPPFTVDTLFDLPEGDLRYEVLDGQLVVTPTPTPAHNLAADRIGRILLPHLPRQVDAVTAMAVRMPSGDGPVPDLVITTGDMTVLKRGLPVETVHTVVEVVSPSSTTVDRVTKAGLYAQAGIPCYWRVELRSWKDHFGPLPAIVVQLFLDGERSEHLFAAGETHDIPLVIGPGAEMITIKLDPADLVGPRR